MPGRSCPTTVMAATGIMHAYRVLHDRPGPAFASPWMCSVSATQVLLQGILAALYQRETTGLGQHVETNLVDAVASRYPVTFYTAPDCVPCGAARNMLSNRGIPFAEKTVTTSEDIEALKRLAGVPSLPFLTIGGQQLRGFAEAEWVQYLDAAGYPRTSQLPPGYARTPATPLVAAQEPLRPRPQAAVQQPQVAPVPVSAPAPADNPSGIRF